MANEFVARNGLIAKNNSVVSGSLTVTGGITGSLLGTASYSSQALSASFATTSSYLNTLNQDVQINGNVNINGTASIAYLNVTYESASVIYSSGSNQFGDATDDTQLLIGRTIVSGSFEVTGSTNIPSLTGSLFGTASFSSTASYVNPLIQNVIVSGSLNVTQSLTTPIIIGGSAIDSGITYLGTTANGTLTASAHTFTGGNNGGTRIATMLNNGNVGFGSVTNPTSRIHVGNFPSADYSNIQLSYLSVIGANTTNTTLGNFGASALGYYMPSNAQGSSILYNGYNAAPDGLKIRAFRTYFEPNASSTGAVTSFTYTGPANTGQTASTNIPGVLWTLGSRQWATGNITTQQEFLLTAPTYSFAGASTITSSYTMFVNAATAGTNATITNNYAAGFSGNTVVAGRHFITNTIGNAPEGYDLEVNKSVNGGVESHTRNTSNGSSAFARTWVRGDGTQQLNVAVYSSGYTPSGLILQNSTALYTGGTSVSNLLIGHYSTSREIHFLSGTTASSIHTMHRGGQTSGAFRGFEWTPIPNTGQTASTNIQGFLFTLGSRQWATGNITTQQEFLLTAPTYSFVGASTITNAYTLYVNAPTASTNATITNNYALGTLGNVRFDDGTVTMIWRAVPTIPSYSGIFLNVNPNSSNYVLVNDGSGNTFLNGVSSAYISVNATNVARFGATFQLFTPVAASSGALLKWQLTVPADTNQTATTNIPNFRILGNNKQWATGNITNQYWNHFTANTASFVGASTITSSYGLFVQSAIAGTNATITNNYAAGFSGSVQILNGNLNITGSSVISNSLTASNILVSSSGVSQLTVVGSGSSLPLFTVQGSQGELFSITDSLSGSLFSVNDISGLPILEVFSDNTTLIGDYQDPMLITTKKVTMTNSGSFVVYSLPTASYDTAFYDYSIRSGSNARAGQIMAIQSGSSVNFTETVTTDFGSTSAVTFSVTVSGSNMVLSGSAATGSWTTKCIIRGL